jgi:hypothetical protein
MSQGSLCNVKIWKPEGLKFYFFYGKKSVHRFRGEVF